MHIPALTALLFAATIAAAQPRTTETIEVSIVNVDVVVSDRDGKRITGLTAADFEIRESGKLQPITNFAEYGATSAGAVATPGIEAAAVRRPPRAIVIFVEWVRLPPFHAAAMYDGLRKLLRDTIAAGDRAMIVSWWSRKMIVRQPFTGDLAKLESVLGVLEQEHMNGPGSAVAAASREAAEAERILEEVDPEGEPENTVDGLDLLLRQREDIKQKTEALQALMNSISGIEGRKILIMSLRTFGKFLGAGSAPGGSIAVERRAELSTKRYRDALVRTANANNIALYVVYPPSRRFSGPGTGSGAPSPGLDLLRGSQHENELFNEAGALIEMAEDTGGLAAWGAAKIAEMLPRIADDLETYYSLGYRVPATGKDVSRRIEVRTKNPAYRVRARTQFVEKSDETEMKDRLVANLYQQFESAAIPIEVIVGELESRGRKRWLVPLRVRIPIRALTTLPRGAHEHGAFSVYAVAGGPIGVMSEVLHRTQPFQLPRGELERARSSHFTYDFSLQIDEKADRVSIGVLDETAKEFGLKRITLPPRK